MYSGDWRVLDRQIQAIDAVITQIHGKLPPLEGVVFFPKTGEMAQFCPYPPPHYDVVRLAFRVIGQYLQLRRIVLQQCHEAQETAIGYRRRVALGPKRSAACDPPS